MKREGMIVKKRGRVYRDGVADTPSLTLAGVQATAVVAEIERAQAAILREMADEFEVWVEESAVVNGASYSLCATRLRERANELDGGGT